MAFDPCPKHQVTPVTPKPSFTLPVFSFTFTQLSVRIIGLPWGLSGKEPTCQWGDTSLTLGSGRSPGEKNGNLLWYSWLGNPMERSLAGSIPLSMGLKRVRHDLANKKQQQIHRNNSHNSHCCWLVAKSCPILCDPMDCSPSDSSVRWILQARILAWVAISYFSRSSQLRNQTHVSAISCIGRRILYHWATDGELVILHIQKKCQKSEGKTRERRRRNEAFSGCMKVNSLSMKF